MHINSYDTEDPVEVGKLTVYVIEVRNEGTSPVTKVVVKNVLPKETLFVSATPDKYKVNKEKTTVRFPAIPTLEPGQKLIFRIVAKAIMPGSAKNRTILRHKEFKREIIDEEGTSIYK